MAFLKNSQEIIMVSEENNCDMVIGHLAQKDSVGARVNTSTPISVSKE